MGDSLPIEEELEQTKILIYKLEDSKEVSKMGVTDTRPEHKYLVFFQNIEFDPENESQAEELFESINEGSEDIDRSAKLSSFDYERYNYNGNLVVMPISNARHIWSMNLQENLKQIFGLSDEEVKLDSNPTSSEFKEVKSALRD